MDDLITFLRAQLDEDERIARAADPGPWKSESLGRHDQAAIKLAASTSLIQFDGSRAAANGMHVSRHDPARVLREINAKRRIVELHHAELVEAVNADGDERSGYWCFECDGEPFPCRTLRLLALPCSDRPGYKDAWRP